MKIGYDLIFFFKDETLNLKGIMTFSNIYIYLKNDEKYIMACIWTTISIYYNKL